MTESTMTENTELYISGSARASLGALYRQWSGWRNGQLKFGQPNPKVSDVAMTLRADRTTTVDPARVVRNPNKVLVRVNPFRLRQEAVLTGTLLHEAAHARFSTWRPCTDEGMKNYVHSDGAPVAPATDDLAQALEEARVEGLMHGALTNPSHELYQWTDLAWTLMIPPMVFIPRLDVARLYAEEPDPRQRLMAFLETFILKGLREFVRDATSSAYWQYHDLMEQVLELYFVERDAKPGEEPDATDRAHAKDIIRELQRSVTHSITSDHDPVDRARAILEELFPNTPPEDMPRMGGGCGEGMAGEGPGEPGEQGSGSGSGSGSGEQSEDDGQSEGEDSGEGEGEGEGDGQSEDPSRELSSREQALAHDTQTQLDRAAATKRAAARAGKKKAEARAAGGEQEPEAVSVQRGNGVGAGAGSAYRYGIRRQPNADNRAEQKRAEQFLRSMIEPAEGRVDSLSESPAATVDGAALQRWKAGGRTGAPRFFQRTRREVTPSPPLKVAVLVDVSSSMNVLQEPSSILSWAIASAAIDLRNFAGRGRQIESTLIHWGDWARVIQANGKPTQGILVAACQEGTQAMPEAMDLVEQEIPGFGSLPDKPEHRLLVQFTDWQLWSPCHQGVTEKVGGAVANGVNMLTILPPRYSRGDHDRLIGEAAATPGAGTVAVAHYDPENPHRVWDYAQQVIDMAAGRQP